MPKQTHSDLFLKPHVAGRAFHTHAVVHYSGSISSLVYSHILGKRRMTCGSAFESDESQKKHKNTQGKRRLASTVFLCSHGKKINKNLGLIIRCTSSIQMSRYSHFIHMDINNADLLLCNQVQPVWTCSYESAVTVCPSSLQCSSYPYQRILG